MLGATIDIGSNTMRLSVYKVENGEYSLIISKKETAGLVNYIVDGKMSDDGVMEAINVLQRFKHTLDFVHYDKLFVFATASLRNVSNSVQVLEAIEDATGLKIELISGEQEAALSFAGAQTSSGIENGCLFDLGGGSTEIVAFEAGEPYYMTSLDMGSLNLYSQHVSGIWPKKREIKAIRKAIKKKLALIDWEKMPEPMLLGVGGSARALRNIVKIQNDRHAKVKTLTRKEIKQALKYLLSGEKEVLTTVLRLCPERLHTIVPGALVIEALAEHLDAKALYVSDFGVREGFVKQRMFEH